MIWDKTKRRLHDGESLVGAFRPAGATADADTAGVLRWSPVDGAELELLDPTDAWPQEFSDEGFAVHGELADGDEVTLLEAGVRTLALGDIPTRITSPGLALGALTDAAERWPGATFTTHNLYPWRDQRGLTVSRPNVRARPHHLRFDWQPPPRDEVDVKGARLRFWTEQRSTAGLQLPTWTMATTQRVRVEMRRALTIKEARRRYSNPLLALTSFAANSPDDVTFEAFWNAQAGRRIEVWWARGTDNIRPWYPGKDRLLVGAGDLPDFAKAVRRWWRLHEKVWPALGIFGDYVRHGSSYSPARFLTLYTAVEAYSREKHGHSDLPKLRRYTGVSSGVTGCTNHALALIGASRKYLAHLGDTGQKFSQRDVEDGAFASTRRLEALMQACLLRELGFTAKQAEHLLATYYARWPVP